MDPINRPKAIDRTVQWNNAVFGYQVGHQDADLTLDKRDSASAMPKSVVIDPCFDWEEDRPPRIPWHQTIIYEVHAKGFTARHPEVPKELRGTYAGFTCQPVLNYLRNLGITAVELLPIHQFVADRHLVERGLTNYWAITPSAFFSPDVRYASGAALGEQVVEFKTKVKALHRAGNIG